MQQTTIFLNDLFFTTTKPLPPPYLTTANERRDERGGRGQGCGVRRVPESAGVRHRPDRRGPRRRGRRGTAGECEAQDPGALGEGRRRQGWHFSLATCTPDLSGLYLG
jgi:hypothetical protein